ncbi:FAD-binding oxidoreductase (plasmid) [Mesorhizobium loti]|nr:FAD-binding oxidoreductase [Mesorhizobium loti]
MLVLELHARGIHFEEVRNTRLPAYAQMHNHDAAVPYIVISPFSEWGLSETLRLLRQYRIYNNIAVSVRAGGHGYFNGASCEGVMINLSNMTSACIKDDVLILDPGGILGQTIHYLNKAEKVVPHGDCYEVAAGGHFTTAGWDVILSRKYGLGCQTLLGGRVVLWDGTVLEVNESSYPDLMWAMRGGAAAEVGVVSRLDLQLVDAPKYATWRESVLDLRQLRVCIENNIVAKAVGLPRELSIYFKVVFVQKKEEPVCHVSLFSLLPVSENISILREHLGNGIMDAFSDVEGGAPDQLLTSECCRPPPF